MDPEHRLGELALGTKPRTNGGFGKVELEQECVAVGTEGDKEGDKTVARQPKSVAVDKKKGRNTSHYLNNRIAKSFRICS